MVITVTPRTAREAEQILTILGTLDIPHTAAPAGSTAACAGPTAAAPAGFTAASARPTAARATLSLYTDGSCRGPNGPGGWAVVAESGGVAIAQTSGSEAATTNNRMELTALITALQYVAEYSGVVDATVYTDSEYVTRGVSSLERWIRHGWRTNDGGATKNRDLWMQIAALRERLSTVGRTVDIQWVRGHAGNAGNERANALAQAASASAR